MKLYFSILLMLGYMQCSPKHTTATTTAQYPVSTQLPTPPPIQKAEVVTGDQQLDILLPKLKDKRVGLIVNHTAVIGKTHLADTLKNLGVNIIRIFGPEHGFRGEAADGELVNDSTDTRTGILVTSLYGKNKKPTPQQLKDIDVLVFDIQDVGTRFYTYISTMHYAMEACAENKKKFIVLDRPNPNAFVDGPMNEAPFKSFVAMHPIPIAHGMTVGELAQMINGEGWLTNKAVCELEIVPLQNWNHDDAFSLPVRPSPNLPNDQAVRMYPYMCLFEGTVISLGRGTPTPFQVLGNPELKDMPYQFTPVDIKGVAMNPPQEGKLCYGLDLSRAPIERKIDLSYLFIFYKAYPDKEKFFLPYFDILAGNTRLKDQVRQGMTEAQIRATWQKDLDVFKKKREKYLLYP